MEGNPFEQRPSAYENHLNKVTQAHGTVIYDLMKRVEMLEALHAEHDRAHAEASRAVLSMPQPKNDERAN